MNRKKALYSACAFLPQSNLKLLFNICKLNPYDSWKIWADEEDNKVILKTDHTIQIHLAKKEKSLFTTNDLYRYSNQSTIIKRSNWVLTAIKNNMKLGLFWGNDDRLRLIFAVEEQTKPMLPLHAGLDLINLAIKNHNLCINNIQQNKELIIKNMSFVPDCIFCENLPSNKINKVWL